MNCFGLWSGVMIRIGVTVRHGRVIDCELSFKHPVFVLYANDIYSSEVQIQVRRGTPAKKIE